MQAIKFLVLRNYTLEPIFNDLKHKFKTKNTKVSFDFSSYDSALPEILKMDNSKLRAYKAILIFLSIETILSNKKVINTTQSINNYKALITNTINHLKKSGITNIYLFSFFNKKFIKPTVSDKKIKKLYQNIKNKNKNNVVFFDLINEINYFHPAEEMFDKRYWNISMFPYNGVGLKLITNILYNKIQQILEFKYKLIILDADNTLWNGVVDEVGFKKINFFNKSKQINYLTFQKKIKEFKKRGILLALCTKNNLSSIQKVFKYNSKKMILKLSDFLVIKANWTPKYKNILSLQKKLNLSAENTLFIDDSNFETDSVNSMIPEIDTQNFLEYKSFYKNIDKILFSKKLKITKEDKIRGELYSHEFKRSNEKDKFGNFNKYIKNLNIVLNIKKNSSKNINRLAQLTQRTNQFNSSAIRLNELEIKKIIKDNKKFVYQCSAEDKFGDYGIIGLAIFEFKEKTAIVSSFLMSCRALGREIENYFFEYLVNEARKLKIKQLFILFKKNSKNDLVYEFLKKNCKKYKKRNHFMHYEVDILNRKNKNKLIKIIDEN